VPSAISVCLDNQLIITDAGMGKSTIGIVAYGDSRIPVQCKACGGPHYNPLSGRMLGSDDSDDSEDQHEKSLTAA
jgi:hypothetical protein